VRFRFEQLDVAHCLFSFDQSKPDVSGLLASLFFLPKRGYRMPTAEVEIATLSPDAIKVFNVTEFIRPFGASCPRVKNLRRRQGVR
jgi:hypothetical protein